MTEEEETRGGGGGGGGPATAGGVTDWQLISESIGGGLVCPLADGGVATNSVSVGADLLPGI